MKKRIGIVGWNISENSFGVTKPYINWLSRFGIVQILSPQEGIDTSLDLLVLPGGLDIAPQSMNEVPGFYTSNTDVMKQFFYDNNLDQYIQAGIPIFGICLGFQQLCVKYGGKLIQNGYFNHSTKSRGEKVDVLECLDPMWDLLDKTSFVKNNKKYEINSLHHQACFKLNEDINVQVLAIEKDSKNIEIAKFSESIYGVQFHPEETYDQISEIIIKKLLKNAS